jgi:hypothetical protein
VPIYVGMGGFPVPIGAFAEGDVPRAHAVPVCPGHVPTGVLVGTGLATRRKAATGAVLDWR